MWPDWGRGTQLGRLGAAALSLIALIAGVGAFCLAATEGDLKILVQQAFEFHQKGQFSQALPLLHRAYQLRPDDYFVNLLLGIDSLRTGETRASIPYLRKASRLRPGEEFPLTYLGEAYARQEIYGPAAEAYLKAVRVAPGSPEGSVAFVDFALARFADMSALLRSSKKGLAAEYRLRALSEGDAARLSLLERAADLDPAAPTIWSDLARTALAAGNLTAAEDDLHRALEADANDLAAWLVDAQLAAVGGNWTRAIKQINAVAQRSSEMLSDGVGQWPKQTQPPAGVAAGAAAKFFLCVREAKTPCGLASRGNGSTHTISVLFREQRWEQVTRLPAPPVGRTDLWLDRGIAFERLQECSQAIPALERGLSASSPDAYGMFLLSWCYSEEAGRTAEQLQRSTNDDASLHIMRGDILLRLQSKADLAVAEYQEALARNPNDPAVLERLAEAQFGAGQTEAARANATAALKIDPQRGGVKRTLAKIAVQDRDYATALPFLRELAARNPLDVTDRVELGKACAQTGSLEEARDNLAPALAHGYPDEKGSLHYLLGNVLKKMGRTAEAEQAFAAAAQLSDAFQRKSYSDQDGDAQP